MLQFEADEEEDMDFVEHNEFGLEEDGGDRPARTPGRRGRAPRKAEDVPLLDIPLNLDPAQAAAYGVPVVDGTPGSANFGDKLPSYEDMIVNAITHFNDPQGTRPGILYQWMARVYPLTDNFRPSASQALQKAFKKGRVHKNGILYRVNHDYVEGQTATRKPTRKPRIGNSNGVVSTTFSAPPYTKAVPGADGNTPRSQAAGDAQDEFDHDESAAGNKQQAPHLQNLQQAAQQSPQFQHRGSVVGQAQTSQTSMDMLLKDLISGDPRSAGASAYAGNASASHVRHDGSLDSAASMRGSHSATVQQISPSSQQQHFGGNTYGHNAALGSYPTPGHFYAQQQVSQPYQQGAQQQQGQQAQQAGVQQQMPSYGQPHSVYDAYRSMQ